MRPSPRGSAARGSPSPAPSSGCLEGFSAIPSAPAPGTPPGGMALEPDRVGDPAPIASGRTAQHWSGTGVSCHIRVVDAVPEPAIDRLGAFGSGDADLAGAGGGVPRGVLHQVVEGVDAPVADGVALGAQQGQPGLLDLHVDERVAVAI